MAQSSTSSPLAPSITRSCLDMEGFLRDLSEAWAVSEPAYRVKKTRVPDSFGDPVRSKCQWPSTGKEVAHEATDVIPRVVVPNMPAAEYPCHMGFLYRATMALMTLEVPHLRAALTTPYAKYVVAAVVASRCGSWAAMSTVPVHSNDTIAAALHYDRKRNALWVRKPGASRAVCTWRWALDSAASVDRDTLEAMLGICTVAPMLACMASSARVLAGGAYAVSYVEEATSRALKSRLSRNAYAVARLDRPLVWDAMRSASVGGIPMSAVRVWATDPVFAVSAEKRIATTAVKLEHCRRREAKLMSRPDSTSLVPTPELADGLESWDVVRAALERSRAMSDEVDDDSESVATDLSLPAPLSDMDDSLVPTVVPSPTQSPPPEMTAQEAATIRQMISGAHSNGVLDADGQLALHGTTEEDDDMGF